MKMFDFNKDMVIGKWSKMYVVGKQVTRKQAKDIISRTDKFISSVTLFPYNTKRHEWINSVLGYTKIISRWDAASDEFQDYAPITWEHENAIDNSKERVYANLGLIELRFFQSLYYSENITSTYSNWIHLDGNIFYEGSIPGCYVTIHDLYVNLEKIAKAFPYLEMIIDVEEDVEDIDEESFPMHSMATLIVRNGKVFVYKISKNGETEYFKDVHYEGIPAPQIEHSIISQEILNDLIIEIGTKFKPIMDNETKILDDLINEHNQN
jgi:hypothetical protein